MDTMVNQEAYYGLSVIPFVFVDDSNDRDRDLRSIAPILDDHNTSTYTGGTNKGLVFSREDHIAEFGMQCSPQDSRIYM